MLTVEQVEHIQGLMVPVDCSFPSFVWVVVLDRESHDTPTDLELSQIKSFAEFTVRRRYLEPAAVRIIQSPPFKHRYSDFATIIFIKGWGRSGDGWHYRFSHWREGPYYVPCSIKPDFRPHTLIEAMDLCENILLENWVRWKQEHPEIFGV